MKIKSAKFGEILPLISVPSRPIPTILFFWIMNLFLLSPAHADFINLTNASISPNIAEIRVLDDRVNVKLEIFIGHLKTFQDLVPDDLLVQVDPKRPSLNERLKNFSETKLQILTDEGIKLQTQLKSVEPRQRIERYAPFAGKTNPFTRQRIPAPPKDKRVLFVELDYPFVEKPKSLTIIPPLDNQGNAAVTIGFIAYHKNVPIIDFSYLSNRALLTLDWNDPWYSKFQNPNLKRHHKFALMTFLYVEPREVRHEVLIRVQDLQNWLDLGIDPDPLLTISEQALVKEKAADFFSKHNPVSIDQNLRQSSSVQIEFLSVSLRGLQVIEEQKPLDYSTALLGIILTYPVKKLPDRAAVKWELFNDRITRLPATATDPAGPLTTFVDVEDPVFEWKNYLLKFEEPIVTSVIVDTAYRATLPPLTLLFAALAIGILIFTLSSKKHAKKLGFGLSLICLVASAATVTVAAFEVKLPFKKGPDETISRQIGNKILTNVNIALLETEPTQFRNQLKQIVAQDKFDNVETEIKRALAIKVAGGGKAQTKEISDLSTSEIQELNSQSGFRTLVEWTADAQAGHWGHTHRRKVQFRALMEIVEIDGVWKLLDMTVLDAKLMS